MRRKRHSTRKASDLNSYWLSFSDLMSVVMLVFVLIMFYNVYNYLDMLEIKTAELLQQSGLLDEKESQLSTSEQQLKSSRDKLTESEQALVLQQAKLLISEKELQDSQALLQRQRAELDETRALLGQQQTQMDQQQTLLQNQQGQMADQQKKLDELVGVRARIISSLGAALSRENVKAKVDGATGSIALDASVLFDVGQSELKPSGMAVLDEFLPVYLSVLMAEENAPNVAEIIIEGHTDTQGSYMTNLELSQRRALAVMQYVLGDEYRAITAPMKEKLKEIATANGRSFSHPIPNADGSVNMEASRRVEFKFRLQDEQMIESMRKLLETMD